MKKSKKCDVFLNFVFFKWQNQVFQRMHSLFVFRYSVRIDFIGLSVAVL